MRLKYTFRRKLSNARALIKYPLIYARLKKHHDFYFFFPFWQIGGGERVHADILEVFRTENSACFVTDESENEGFKKEFEAYADTIELGRWSTKRSFSKLMKKKIAAKINKHSHPVVFGCHSHFFYELIPDLGNHVKVIDLIHAFTFDPNGPEIYSLPHVHRLNSRVILGEKTRNDFKKLYKEKGIAPEHLNKFTIIPNKVPLPDKLPAKDYSGNLKILFVSRNAPEKRPEIFLSIAEYCQKLQLPTEFIMVGDFSDLNATAGERVHLVGEVYEREELNKIYREAHIILVTSWREGFPLVIMEGMGHGVVPISTDVGEVPRYISSITHRNGFLVEDNEKQAVLVEEFAHHIHHLCQNRNTLKRFSRNAHNFAVENFGEENFKLSYRKLLASEMDKSVET